MLKPMEQTIRQIIAEDVRPYLIGHLGDIELVAVEGDTVYVHLTGACKGCPSAGQTLGTVVLENLQKQIPEIRKVVLEQPVSDELLHMARVMLNFSKRKPEQ